MNSDSIINGQTGGQQLIGGKKAYYNLAKTPWPVIDAAKNSVRRKRFLPLPLWEIEAIEHCNVDVKETIAYEI